MHPVLVLQTPIRIGLPTEVTATPSLVVAGKRPMVIREPQFAAQRVAIAVESTLVGGAVSPR
jgi:hypothetical protein